MPFLNAHVFVDADNIPSEKIPVLYENLFGRYNLRKFDVYAAKGYRQKIQKLQSDAINLNHTPHSGKNSTDMLIAMSVADAIAYEKGLEAIIIVSSDRDFIVPIEYALSHGKKVVCIFMQESIANTLLTQNQDKNLTLLNIDELDTEINCVLPKWVKESVKGNDFLTTYLKREFRGETVVLDKAGMKVRVPFVDGMNHVIFRALVKEFGFNVAGKKKFDKLLAQANLYLDGTDVRKQTTIRITKIVPRRTRTWNGIRKASAA